MGMEDLFNAMIGFYTKWLLLPSFVGFLIFLYGVMVYKDQPDSEELCASTATLCAACETCEYTQVGILNALGDQLTCID